MTGTQTRLNAWADKVLSLWVTAKALTTGITGIRPDTRGESGTGWIAGLIFIVVSIFVFLALLTPIAWRVTNATENESIDTTTATLLVLIPLLLVVAVVLLIVGFAKKGAE